MYTYVYTYTYIYMSHIYFIIIIYFIFSHSSLTRREAQNVVVIKSDRWDRNFTCCSSCRKKRSVGHKQPLPVDDPSHTPPTIRLPAGVSPHVGRGLFCSFHPTAGTPCTLIQATFLFSTVGRFTTVWPGIKSLVSEWISSLSGEL